MFPAEAQNWHRHSAAQRLVALGVCLHVCCFIFAELARAEQPATASHGLESFFDSTLLRRFDANRDGVLDQPERVALRGAFGEIDVPMLPEQAFAYTSDPSVVGLQAWNLPQLDSTPADNPLSDAGASLGRVLFYDRQMSRNNTIACASCHLQARGFADPRQFSLGFEGRPTQRNAMGLANLRYTRFPGGPPGFFWDERAATLEDQVLMPIQDQVEMGMELSALEAKLQALPYYPPLFEQAFGSTAVTRERIARAVAQFMRAMTSFQSRFDHAAQASNRSDLSGDFAELTPAENLGKSLFVNGVGGVAEIGCAHCHVPPTFGMPKALNNGLSLHYQDPGLGGRDVPSNDPLTSSNDGKFKAPSLRNIALTAPYMHDGRFQTLEQVIEHYSSGVHPHKNLGLAFGEDALVGPGETSGFRLTPPQKSALIAFLRTLTDEAFIRDPKFSDPFIRLADPK